MSTHPVGKGSANLSINVPISWRGFFGRRAFTMDITMGELIRRILAKFHFVWLAPEDLGRASFEDNLAVAILREAIADGVTTDDLPAIKQAIELISDSARIDAELSANLDVRRPLAA